MLDRYVEGTVERISPEAPVPVVHVTRDRSAPGGAANVAAGVIALGGRCALVAAVGEDGAGAELRDGIGKLGVSAAHIVATPGRPTTQKTRVLGGRQQMLRVDREASGPLPSDVTEALAGGAIEALSGADVLVIQDYDKGAITPELGSRLIDAAAERGVPVVVDPKLRHFFDFRGAHLFKPNRRELAAGLGMEEGRIDEIDFADIVDRLGVANLLLTLGSEGMLLVGRDVGGVERIPSRAREVFDVTGAGDTVLAVMALAVAGGWPLADGARLASVAAGLQVSHAGAVPITADALLEELDHN